MLKKIFLLLASIMMTTVTQAKENDMAANKILVAYFSATGTTAGVAQKLATAINADLFEIKPQQPYTDADLNWRDQNSRSSVEMSNRDSRPAIADKVEDMSKYDVIFIGFPIWWYREPSIIDTFAQSYDFAGKTIIPFVTSGSSDIGNCGANIQSLAPQAKVLNGKRFSGSVSEEELKKWASEWL